MATFAAVVRCANASHLVFGTAQSLERQTAPIGTIVIATDDSTPPAAAEWLEHLAKARQWRFLLVSGSTPGTVWNAGFEITKEELVVCLDAGDELRPDFTQAMASGLAVTNAPTGTSAILERGPGSATDVDLPVSVDEIVSRIDASRRPMVVRRSAWAALGRFDEQLSSLEGHELFIRAVVAQQPPFAHTEALVSRVRRKSGLYRQSWDAASLNGAIAHILERHRPHFERALGSLIFQGHKTRAHLRLRNRELLGQRTAGLEEMERLRAQITGLRQQLPEQEGQAVDLGELRRVTPVSRDWGYQRGGPVDRHYIEEFLSRHAADISGAGLEVQEPDYSERYGGGRVTRADVVDLDPANPRATIISDLRAAANIPSATYDCVILTQTIHVIDDMAAVAAEVARILKPGGVLLATLPSASRVCVEYGEDGDFWRVTGAGARAVFARAFPHDDLEFESRGNVLVNTAFMFGLGAGELTSEEYGFSDPYYPALITVRATRPRPPAASGILLYHRVADTTGSDVHRLSVSPVEFERQMTVLRDHFRPMPLRELAALLQNGSPPDGAVAVTFDDGYLDNLEVASPILQRLGIPATFFCTAESMDEPAYEYWWDVLEHVLLAGPTVPAELTLDWRGQLHTWPTRTPYERSSAHDAVYALIVSAPATERRMAIDALRHWSGDRESTSGARRITTAELRDLASRPGHDIGAHSVQHLMLPDQHPDTQREEVVSSQRTLAAAVGRPIDSFAYPFGAWNQAVRDVVGAAGFTTAVACGDRALDGTEDPLALPRLDPASRGPGSFEDWLRRRVRPRATSPS